MCGVGVEDIPCNPSEAVISIPSTACAAIVYRDIRSGQRDCNSGTYIHG